ncbi:MAG: hypothetical protein ACLQDY_28690 [Streptosporangiaceae bacterium]
MNNDELITTVRESVTDMHMTIPEEQIVSRSRAIRARRRVPAAAGALAVAAGTAVAVTALVPSGHQPGHPVSARLAAWTVAQQASGDINVTINQLQNPAGLQSTLRADGVPRQRQAAPAFPSMTTPAAVSRPQARLRKAPGTRRQQASPAR